MIDKGIKIDIDPVPQYYMGNCGETSANTQSRGCSIVG